MSWEPSMSYEKASRLSWVSSDSSKPNLEALSFGCLQRIASSQEAMAESWVNLQRENARLAESATKWRKDAEQLLRRLRATRGLVTRLKHQLTNAEKRAANEEVRA